MHRLFGGLVLLLALAPVAKHARAQTPLAPVPIVQVPSGGSAPTYHVVQPTFGCEDPRAERALTDTASARLNDPEWLQFFMTQGKCVRVPPSKSWDVLSSAGDMLVMQEHGRPAAPALFFRPDLVSAAQETPPSAADATTPPDAQPAPIATNPGDVFAEAQADRKAWDTWIASLQGDGRAGAEDWARQWGTPQAASCDAPGKSQDWQNGCQAARLHSIASDMRRQSEPYYAQGWNAPFGSAPPANPATAASGAPDEVLRKSVSFKAGQADRKKWDAWFSGFLGDYRTGAAFWLAQWEAANPAATCANMAMTQTWRDGCEMAKRKLSAYDARIKSDPIYVRGWKADETAADTKQATALTQSR